jgi:hypothetical protein
MRQLGCFVIIAIIAIIALIAALVVGLYYMTSDRLAHDVAVDLPTNDARARVQWWSGSDWMPYARLIVERDTGERVDTKMWTNWGVATRGSFYITPENWLVVAHPGGGTTVVTISKNSPLKELHEFDLKHSPSEVWNYIGAVDGYQHSSKFFSPKQQRECIPMFGMKFEPGPRFRFDQQVPQDCDWSININ